MTDLDRLKDFYSGIGVKLKPSSVRSADNIIFIIGYNCLGEPDVNQSEDTVGYSGFYTEIEFTKEGKFVRQGFWE